MSSETSTPPSSAPPPDPRPVEAPSAAPPAAKPPSLAAELVRRRIPHVALAYLGGTWTFFQFVQWSVRRFGLTPSWEEATLVGLLLVMPSVLFLTYRHGAPGQQRRRRSDLLLSVANVLVAVAVGAVLVGRVPDEARLMTAAVAGGGAEVAARPQVGIFAFDNQSGDAELDWLRTGLPVLLQYDLAQDPGLGLFTVVDVAEQVRQAGVRDVYHVPLTVQRDIAEEQVVPFVISGTVDRVGDVYTMGYDLHDAASGRALAQRRVTGADLFVLVDSLSVALKADVGLGERAGIVDLPVAEVTTPSLEAFRVFAEGHHAWYADNAYETADAHLEAAVALDPAFAAAHLAQYGLKTQLQQDGAAVAALRRAQQYRYRLNQRQQYATNYVQLFMGQKPDEALAVLEQWMAYDPNDAMALVFLARLRQSRGEMDESIRLYQRLIDLGPTYRNYLPTLGSLLRSEGRYDEARTAFEAYVEAFPRETQGYLNIGALEAVTGRWDEALVAYRQAVAADPNHYLPHVYLLDLYTRLGRLADAQVAAGEALALARTAADSISVLSTHATFHRRRGRLADLRTAYEQQWALQRHRVTASDVLHSQAVAAAVLAELGGVAEGRALIEAVQADPSIATATTFRRLDLQWHAVQTTVIAGELTAARAAFDAFMVEQEAVSEAYALDRFDEWMKVKGRLDLLAGDPAAAIETLERYTEETPFDYDGWRLLGDAWRAAGDRRAAAAAYAQALSYYPVLPEAHLGLAYLARRPDEAREHLERAFAAWAEADPAHPGLVEARALAARMP